MYAPGQCDTCMLTCYIIIKSIDDLAFMDVNWSTYPRQIHCNRITGHKRLSIADEIDSVQSVLGLREGRRFPGCLE